MKVFPQQHDPMADWLEVAAVPGVWQALQAIKNDYRLFVAPILLSQMLTMFSRRLTG